MKKLYALGLGALLLAGASLFASSNKTENETAKTQKIAVVNYETCLMESEEGKVEKGNFEKMRQEMEAKLKERETSIKETVAKLEDVDYLDSISQEAEKELRKQVEKEQQEYFQLASQMEQAGQQAQFLFIRKMNNTIKDAAKTVARRNGVDLVLRAETCSFFSNEGDLTEQVLREMNKNYESLQAEEKTS